jgi:hypothetical protein
VKLLNKYDLLLERELGKPVKKRFFRKKSLLPQEFKDPFELKGPKNEVKKALGLVKAYGEGIEYSRLTRKIMKVQHKIERKLEEKKLRKQLRI